MFKNMTCIKSFFCLATFAFLLSGCTQQNGQWTFPNMGTKTPVQTSQEPTIPDASIRTGDTTKIGVLLPLTGKGSNVAPSLLNAAQLAIFDMPNAKIELLPKDTNGTVAGAITATETALREGVDVIIGPLFADNVKGASRYASSQSPVLGFTNDWTAATPSTFTLGFLPHAQAERVLSYAINRGAKDFVFITPQNEYGRLVLQSGQRLLQSSSLPPARVVDASSLTIDQTLESMFNAKSPDAIFMPLPPQDAARIANVVRSTTTSNPLLLGSGLWEDAITLTYPSLSDAYYAGVGTPSRTAFENKYRRNFGTSPAGVTSLAYDAVSLIGALNTRGLKPNTQNLTSASGYNGVDGYFRLRPDGLVDRTLSILQIKNGNRLVVE